MDTLEFAINSVEELINEVDTTIREEFSDYSERLDEVIMLLNTTDRSDVVTLTSQMDRMHHIVHIGTHCPCTHEARWHACLGRLETAISAAAQRMNERTVRAMASDLGLDYDEIAEFIRKLADSPDDELPDLPIEIIVPDDIKDIAP